MRQRRPYRDEERHSGVHASGLCHVFRSRISHNLGGIMDLSTRAETSPVRRWRTEPWPRLFEWLDSMTPGDLVWHPGYDHMLRMEQFQRNGEMVIRLEIPGVDPDEDIDVTLEDDVLTIDARREERREDVTHSEFRYGHLQRCISIPMGVTEDDISASYADGVLEIAVTAPTEIEKAEHSRRIPIMS
jgi:HSP20 family protein